MPTIRSRLILLITACILPMALLATALIVHNYQRENAQLVRDAVATTRALSSVVDRELSAVESALTVLATSSHLDSGDFSAFYGQAKDVLRTEIADNVVLTDTTGRQVINTFRPFGETLTAQGIMPQLRRVLDTGRPFVSDLFVGPVTGRLAVSVSVPVRRNGQIIYNLSMGFFPGRLSEILTQQQLPLGWTGEILDRGGNIAARTHDLNRFVGRQSALSLTGAMSADGSVEAITAEGIPVVSVFTRSAVSDWAVVINIPKESLVSQLKQSLVWLVVGTVVLLSGSLLVAWRLGGRIADAFRGLTDPALALGSGEPVVIRSLDLKEADEVAAALMKASRMLQQARHDAHHDELTGLGNRALFKEIVDQQLALSRRQETELALLYIDLDGFKAVNDRFGHPTGDELLRVVSQRIRAGIRSSDLAVRVGGDEFVVVMFAAGSDAAQVLANKLVESISDPYPIGLDLIEISASIGVAICTNPEFTSQMLLEQADAAMYQAKTVGKRCFALAPASVEAG